MELDQIKSAVEVVGKAFEEFKDTHSKAQRDNDVLLTDKMARLSEDITSRHAAYMEDQAAKHAALTVQLNAIEARGQRSPEATEHLKGAEGRAELFAKSRRDIQSHIRGGQYIADVDSTARYEKSFIEYMRRDKDGMDPEVRKDLSVGSDPDGGYWITPPTMAAAVVARVYETSPMRQLASVITIGTREYSIPEDPNDVGAGWVGERGPITTSSTMQVQRRIIPAQELYAEPAVTTQMLEDSQIDIESYLAAKLADKFARVENTAFVLGTGVNQPRGLMTYASGTTWGSQIERIGSGTSGAFTYNGLINIITSIKDKYQGNASWLIRRASIASIMELVDGASRLIFQPILNGSFNNTPLLGYPIHYAADIAAVGAGALAAAFGDFKAGYQIVDRVGMSTLRDNVTSKPNILFYTRKRVGGDLLDFDSVKIQVLT